MCPVVCSSLMINIPCTMLTLCLMAQGMMLRKKIYPSLVPDPECSNPWLAPRMGNPAAEKADACLCVYWLDSLVSFIISHLLGLPSVCSHWLRLLWSCLTSVTFNDQNRAGSGAAGMLRTGEPWGAGTDWSCIFYETGVSFNPSESKILRKDGVIVSNSLAAFAYIRGTSSYWAPESLLNEHTTALWHSDNDGDIACF